jgi:hypothetical protein
VDVVDTYQQWPVVCQLGQERSQAFDEQQRPINRLSQVRELTVRDERLTT